MTVSVNVSAPSAVAAGATTFYGVNQTTPVGTFYSATGAASSKSVTLGSAVGEFAIAGAASRAVSSFTSGGAQTQRWTGKTGTSGGDVWGLGGTATGAPSVTLSWSTTGSGTGAYAFGAVSLRPAAPGVPITRTGAGVTVAVIDSALLQDGGGTARIKTTRDFTTGNANPAATTALDAYGHGTHVAGLIGDEQNEADIRGVAPGVQYVSLRVLDGTGQGATSNVMHAIQWAVTNKATYVIDILNLSLGHPIYEAAATDPLVQAVEAAVRAGLVVVVAAGNHGVNPQTGLVGFAGISSPANAPSAITVGAEKTFDTTSRTDDLVADYSSRRPTWYDAFAKPDLVAPGHRLLGPATSTQGLFTSYPTLRGPLYGTRKTIKLSGTIMAAGVVSGTVALMIEDARATFGDAPTPNAIKAMLQDSAFPLSDAGGVAYDALVQGAGGLNAAGAVALAHAINATAALHSNWLVTGITKSTTVDGQQIVWGDQIVGGDVYLQP